VLQGLEQQLAGALRPLGSRMQHAAAADSNKRSLALPAAQVYSHPLLQPHLSCPLAMMASMQLGGGLGAVLPDALESGTRLGPAGS